MTIKYHMIYLPEHRMVFIHNPKTAGTSIATWLEDNFKVIRGRKHGNWQEAHKFFPQAEYMFGVVRNPLDRLVSWHKFANGNTASTFKDWVIKNVFQYEPALSFSTPLQWAKPWYKLTTPQCEWFDTQTEILHFETLGIEFEKIQEKLGCNKPLPVLNSTHDDSYLDYYDWELQELVREIYLEDIIKFEYEI